MVYNCTVLVMGRNESLKQCLITALFIEKYWPDCQYEKVLCTQTQAGENVNKYDRIIYTDENLIWGDRLKYALDEIRTEYIIMLPEDFFLKSYVDSKAVERYINLAKEENAGAIRINPPVLFSAPYSHELREIKKGMLYRIALQPTLYKKEYLIRFAGRHLSPWQFERLGTDLSIDYDEKVFCTCEKIYPCIHAWSHRSWTYEAYILMKRSDIPHTLYNEDRLYPVRQVIFDKIYVIAVKTFPKFVNKLALIKASKGEKKLKW